MPTSQRLAQHKDMNRGKEKINRTGTRQLTLGLVGIGVGIAGGLARLAAKKTVEVGASLVGLALCARVNPEALVETNQKRSSDPLSLSVSGKPRRRQDGVHKVPR
jgi:hypothetical protein